MDNNKAGELKRKRVRVLEALLPCRVKAPTVNPVLPGKTKWKDLESKPTSEKVSKMINSALAKASKGVDIVPTPSPAEYSSKSTLSMGALIALLTNSGVAMYVFYTYACRKGMRSDVKVLQSPMKQVAADLETAADNATSLEDMPEVFFTILEGGAKAFRTAVRAVGSLPELCNMQAVRMLLKGTDAKLSFIIGGAGVAAKTPIFSLIPDHREEVRKALATIGVALVKSKIKGIVQEALDVFPLVMLKATVTEAVLFSEDFAPVVNLFSDGNGKTWHRVHCVIDATSQEVVAAHDSFLELMAEAGKSASVGIQSSDFDVSSAAFESATINKAEAIAVLSELDGSQQKELAVYVLAMSVKKYPLFERAVQILRIASLLHERPANVVDLIKEATSKYAEVSQEQMVEHAVSYLENGMVLITPSVGNAFEVSCQSVWKGLDPFQTALSRISASKKVGKKWEIITDQLLDTMKPVEWFQGLIAQVVGVDIVPRDKPVTRYFSPMSSFRGVGVARNEDGVFKTSEASLEIGAEFNLIFSPLDKAVCTAAFKVDSDNRMKVLKRLSLAGGSYQGGIYLPDLELREFRIEGDEDSDRHSGRFMLHPKDFFGPKWKRKYTSPFILNGGRFLQIKERLGKGVIEVNEDCPLGVLLYTKGTTKDELEVLTESPWLLYGYKSDREGARTSFCNLSQPSVIEQAGRLFIDNGYALAEEQTLRASETHRMGIPSVGLACGVATKAIGNSNNATRVKFSMFDLGVLKLYVRQEWIGVDKDLDPSGITIRGSVCIISCPKDFARICSVCGGADCDDVYYVERVIAGYQVRRDPNIGIDVAFVKAYGTRRLS